MRFTSILYPDGTDRQPRCDAWVAGCAPGELLERPAPDDYTLVVD